MDIKPTLKKANLHGSNKWPLEDMSSMSIAIRLHENMANLGIRNMQFCASGCVHINKALTNTDNGSRDG